MKKNIIYTLIIITFLFCFSKTTPVVASPSEPNEPCNTTTNPTNTPCAQVYNFLSPLPDPDKTGTLKDTFDPSKPDSLSVYLNMIIKLFIGICAVLAVIMIVVGGMQYMTADLASSKEEGTSRIKGAVFGLILALASYAILYTINPDLLSSDLSSLKEAKIIVEIDTPQTYDPVTKKYQSGDVYGNKWDNSVGLNAVLPQYVTLNTGQCTYIGQTSCTSIRKLDTTKVQAIQWGCGCNLIISGGTEFWLHGGRSGSTSHQRGNTTVDLRRNPQLDAYLSGGKPLVVMQRYDTPVGSVLYEGNHWHIGP